jgi:hypothetical protein
MEININDPVYVKISKYGKSVLLIHHDVYRDNLWEVLYDLSYYYKKHSRSKFSFIKRIFATDCNNKTFQFNMNSIVTIHLTDFGKNISDIKSEYYTCLLFELIREFGKYLYNGGTIPFDTNIVINE